MKTRGEIYKYDTSNFSTAYDLKQRHMQKCKLLELSEIVGNTALIEFMDGKREQVSAEYLVSVVGKGLV